MKTQAVRIMAASAIVTMLVSGCATSGKPLTGKQLAGRCALYVVIGAGLGSTKNKAGAGAAAGLAACLLNVAFNASEKKRIRDAQAKAAATGKPLEQSWRDEHDTTKSVKVTTGNTEKVKTAGAVLLCRPLETTLTVGEKAATQSEQWCRAPDGSYRPRSEFAVA